MAEQKEQMNLNIEGKNLILNAKDILINKPEYCRWEFKAKLDKLGSKGKQRLIIFMESLGFACEDMDEEGKRRFFPKEYGKRIPNELSYTLALGVFLYLGYDCVTKDREVIALYKGETK